MENQPHIQLVLGPMYSGKTSELIRRLRRYKHAKKRVLVIKFAADQRYFQDTDSTAVCSTHDKHTMEAKAATTLLPLLSQLNDVDVIGIDEGQFYSDVVEFAEAAANSGKIVIIACLDGDFLRRPFGRVLELIPLCEKLDKLSSICANCYGEASFTHRTVASKELQLIGGDEAYVPHCRACFLAATTTAAAASSSDVVSTTVVVTTPPPPASSIGVVALLPATPKKEISSVAASFASSSTFAPGGGSPTSASSGSSVAAQ